MTPLYVALDTCRQGRRFDIKIPLCLVLLFSSFLVVSIACHSRASVLIGLDQIHDHQQLFSDKNIGLVTNHTAVNRRGAHILDVFAAMPGVRVVAIYSPEHGVRGEMAAGEAIENGIDPAGIPVYSLYGAAKKPTAAMLNGVEMLVFDMQDIGARFYTYIWTLYYAMCAAAENNIPFVVLDRPNPLADRMEGPLLDRTYASFVGLLPLPVRHGMTVGELAQLFCGEGWLGDGLALDLTVIPLRHWRRDMWYDETGLEFVAPSPNMPTLETATVYPGICLLEGTNVSEGRGTDSPFLLFGAPWIKGDELCARLNALQIAGVRFVPADFTPVSLPGKAVRPKYENARCFGARVIITDRQELDAFSVGIAVVKTLFEMYPDFQFLRNGYFDNLAGTDKVRLAIQSGGSLEEIQNIWAADLRAFALKKEKYCIYELLPSQP